jgi:hypothetical protein
MKRFIVWFALALFPNSSLANKPVKVSRKELLALKRENVEAERQSMDDPSNDFYIQGPKNANLVHDSLFLSTGRRIDGSEMDESESN